MSSDTFLIVDQHPSAPTGLPELLKRLARDHGLDAYICRQRLLGPAQSLLAKGTAEVMSAACRTLKTYGFRAWALAPRRPEFSPFLLTSLQIGTESLLLTGREKQLRIQRGARLLILLADLSGHLAERSLNQVLSAHRYQGTAANGGLPHDKWQRVILQGRPVVDIYLLDAEGTPQEAVRAVPGKFDHRGLGPHASLSSSQNLFNLMELARDYADTCRVDMRFGLSLLPDANLESTRADDPEVLKRNLRNLTRYGWLQAELDVLVQGEKEADEPEALAAELTLAASAVLPALAAAPTAQRAMRDTLARERESPTPQDSPGIPGQPPAATLPTPPDALRHNLWQNPRVLISGAVFLATMLGSYLGHSAGWLAPLLETAVRSGSLSGIGALACFYSAFRLLHLKRLIENTPTSKIRSLAMGMVEIHGTARRQYALLAPMTHIACVFYRLTRYRRNHKGTWVVSSVTSSGHVPFWLEDETGRVSVDPSGASVKPAHRQESFEEGSVAFGGFSSSDEKWLEELIYDGAPVYVLGEARVRQEPGSRRHQRRTEALRRLKQDPQRMADIDTNGDGRIDEDEWQTARDAVEQQLLHEDLAASSERKRQEEHIVISRPHYRSLPFVIAESAAETQLIRGYALWSGVLLGCGGICAALTAWLLIK